MNLPLPSLLFLVTLLPFSAASADNIVDCKATIAAYAELRDNGPRQKYQDLFTADATFVFALLNIRLEGAEAIGNRLDNAHKSGRAHSACSGVSSCYAGVHRSISSKAYFSVWLGDNAPGSFPTESIQRSLCRYIGA